jgi:hypothetical protein
VLSVATQEPWSMSTLLLHLSSMSLTAVRLEWGYAIAATRSMGFVSEE